MAVYNNIEYLPAATESILEQTFQDFEFIIVDDGSDDGSTEWLSEKAEKDSRIILIKHENIGLTRSLNIALQRVKGEFVARMDGDDICHPERFKIQLEFMRANQACVCTGSYTNYINHKSQHLFQRSFPLEHEAIIENQLAGLGGLIQHPSAFIRTKSLKDIGGYDESFRYGQDYDLWFRLARVGKIANIPKALLYYRYHSSAITQRSLKAQKECTDRIITRELAIRKLKQRKTLAKQYEINPTDRWWLMVRASQEGNALLTLKLWRRLLIKNYKEISRSTRLLLLSITNRSIKKKKGFQP